MKTPQFTESQKIKWIYNIAILAFLAASIYAPNLWLNQKDFPVIPLFDWIYIPLAPIDLYIKWVFLGLMTLLLFYKNRYIGLFVVLLYVYLCLVDQNRLQPYLYQSILTLLAVDLFPKKTNAKTILYTVALVFFATYFWSGVQKVNPIFYNQWMHALTKHFSFLPHKLLLYFTYAVPHIEWLMGVFLLLNQTRKAAVISIIGMHAIIIGVLFYLGYGFNVVPWNVQNIASVWILFWTLKTHFITDIFSVNFDYRKGILLLFTMLLPFSNIFGYWDHLLSFSFFTSKLNYYYIQINDKELQEKLPKNIQKYYRPHNGKVIIYANEWAGDVNKVLFYPERRTIDYLDAYLKSFSKTSNEKSTTLVVYNK